MTFRQLLRAICGKMTGKAVAEENEENQELTSDWDPKRIPEIRFKILGTAVLFHYPICLIFALVNGSVFVLSFSHCTKMQVVSRCSWHVVKIGNHSPRL